MEPKDNITTSAIEQAVRTAFNKYETQRTDNSLSDLYLHYDDNNHTLCIYDDTENLLTEAPMEKHPDTRAVRSVLQKLEKEGLFNKEFIYKPFTVDLVDEDFIVTEELLFLDDDTLKLDGELWAGIEKELDDFLKDLMK